MIFLTLLIIPVLIALFAMAFGHGRITTKEFLLHLAAQVVIALISVGIIYNMNVKDIEILNGQVTSKARVKVHCRHSYPCHCVTVSCGKGCMTTICQTCYDHDYDIDWNVYTNIGDWRINTLDSQGLKEPPRWTIVSVSDPVSKTNSYENYIKGAPNTLFRYQGLEEKYSSTMAQYPQSIYDYYKLDRVVLVKYGLPNIKEWNDSLALLNGKVGYQKGCNIILVIGSNLDRDYFYALSQHWIGGKKNDIAVLLDMDGDKIKWAKVMAWTDREIFKVQLRNQILDIGTLDREKLFAAIEKNIQLSYVRKSMKDFEYLKASVKPTTTQWMWAMTMGVVASILLAVWFYREDVA